MSYVDRPCREQAEVIVMVGRYDHVARRYLDSHMYKRSPGEPGCHFLCSLKHRSSNFYQDLTVCITHHDDSTVIIEYCNGNNAIQVPDLRK